jgi:hypothetical protein
MKQTESKIAVQKERNKEKVKNSTETETERKRAIQKETSKQKGK